MLFRSHFASVLLALLLSSRLQKATQDTESHSQPPAQTSFVTYFFKILINVPSCSLPSFPPTRCLKDYTGRSSWGSAGVRPGCHISVTRTWGPPCAGCGGERTVTLSTPGSRTNCTITTAAEFGSGGKASSQIMWPRSSSPFISNISRHFCAFFTTEKKYRSYLYFFGAPLLFSQYKSHIPCCQALGCSHVLFSLQTQFLVNSFYQLLCTYLKHLVRRNTNSKAWQDASRFPQSTVHTEFSLAAAPVVSFPLARGPVVPIAKTGWGGGGITANLRTCLEGKDFIIQCKTTCSLGQADLHYLVFSREMQKLPSGIFGRRDWKSKTTKCKPEHAFVQLKILNDFPAWRPDLLIHSFHSQQKLQREMKVHPFYNYETMWVYNILGDKAETRWHKRGSSIQSRSKMLLNSWIPWSTPDSNRICCQKTHRGLCLWEKRI